MNQTVRRMLAVAVLSLLPISATAADEPTNPAAAVAKEHIMVTIGDMEWDACTPAIPPGAKCVTLEGDLNTPDKLFTYRLWLPDGYKVQPHFHPADEHVTVLTGTFNMGMGKTYDEKKAKILGPGSYVVMPKGEPHFAYANGITVIQVHAIGPWGITYVNPEDDPRKSAAK